MYEGKTQKLTPRVYVGLIHFSWGIRNANVSMYNSDVSCVFLYMPMVVSLYLENGGGHSPSLPWALPNNYKKIYLTNPFMTCLETATIFSQDSVLKLSTTAALNLTLASLYVELQRKRTCREFLQSSKGTAVAVKNISDFPKTLFMEKTSKPVAVCVRACPHTQPTLNNSLIHSSLNWYQLTSGYAGLYWSSGGEKLNRSTQWMKASHFFLLQR